MQNPLLVCRHAYNHKGGSLFDSFLGKIFCVFSFSFVKITSKYFQTKIPSNFHVLSEITGKEDVSKMGSINLILLTSKIYLV